MGVGILSGKNLEATNKSRENRAAVLLYEAIQNALTMASRGTKVRNIHIRIPMHGTELGQPTKSIETE